MSLKSLLIVGVGIFHIANAIPHQSMDGPFFDHESTAAHTSMVARSDSLAQSAPTPAPFFNARRRRPPRDSADASSNPEFMSVQLSQISDARLSAFGVASQAQAGATPAANRIVCPVVIGAAPIPSKSSTDVVSMRRDPNAIKYLQGRESHPPHGRKSKHTSTTTQALTERAVEDDASLYPSSLAPRSTEPKDEENDEDDKRCGDGEVWVPDDEDDKEPSHSLMIELKHHHHDDDDDDDDDDNEDGDDW